MIVLCLLLCYVFTLYPGSQHLHSIGVIVDIDVPLSRISTSLVAISLILLVLQYTIFSTYMLVFVFYLNLILSLLTLGHHALAVAAILSLSAVLLVLILLVKNSSSVSIESSSYVLLASADSSLSKLTLEIQITFILCIMLTALTLIHVSTSQSTLTFLIRSTVTVSGPHLSCSSNVGSLISLGTVTFLVALTPSYSSMVSELFILPAFLLTLVLLSIHDEGTATQTSGVNTVLDQQSQSVLSSMIILIEYLLFAGFCIPF